jgi:hypothetical protein
MSYLKADCNRPASSTEAHAIKGGKIINTNTINNKRNTKQILRSPGDDSLELLISETVTMPVFTMFPLTTQVLWSYQ